MGRKSMYDSNVKPRLNEIKKWFKMTEAQIAGECGVSSTTFETYKREHEELRKALNERKVKLAAEVYGAIIKRALGFHEEDVKTSIRNEAGKKIEFVEKVSKYYPPDVGACHLLLKNLDETWTNDDKETMSLKRAKLELEKLKAEAENW